VKSTKSIIVATTMGRLFLSILAALCLIATRSVIIAQELRGSAVEGNDNVNVHHGEMSDDAWRQSHSHPSQEQGTAALLERHQSRELARPKKKKSAAAGFQTSSGLNWKRNQKPRNYREPQDFNQNLASASQTTFAKRKGGPASIAKYAPKKKDNKKKRDGRIKAGFKNFRSEIKNTGSRLKKALAKRKGGKRGKKTGRRKNPGGVKPKGTPSTKNTPNMLPESTGPQNPLKGQPTLPQSQPNVPNDQKPKPQVIPALPILQDQPSLESGELEPVETVPETSSQSQTANAKEPTPAPVMLAVGAQESDEPPASPSIWSPASSVWSPAASPFSPAFTPSEYEE
jgi:hypothetical protein